MAMPTGIRNLITWAAARIPTLLTLAGLGALAFWGRYNDWRLSPSRPEEQQAAKQTPAEPAISVLPCSTPPRSAA
jgi:hypothetical protein